MNYNLFATLFNEAREYEKFDMFLGERGWQEWMNEFSEDNIVPIMRKIFTMSKKSTGEIIKDYKTMCKDSNLGECGIPYRTLQNWTLGTREPAPYVISLIAYAIFESEETNEKEQ